MKLALWTTAMLLLAPLAWAHHSFAMFDEHKTLSLTGTVKTWEWTNPHSWLVVQAADANGNDVEWQIEGSSPTIFRRVGLARDAIKVGDRVTVVIYALRSGASGGQLRSVTTADGMTYDLAAALQP